MTASIAVAAVSAGVFSLATIRSAQLPFTASDEVVSIQSIQRHRENDVQGVSAIDFRDWRRQTHEFDAMAIVSRPSTLILSSEASTGAFEVASVSPGYFEILGIHSVVGAAFPHDSALNDGIVLTYTSWRRLFGELPPQLGVLVRIEGTLPVPVVSVLKPDSRPPGTADAWRLWNLDRLDAKRRATRTAFAIGVIKGGGVNRAENELASIANTLATEFPSTNKDWTVRVRPLRWVVLGDSSQVIGLMLLAASLTLFLATTNVMYLRLLGARETRRHMAIRQVLGAPRMSLVSEVVGETSITTALTVVLSVPTCMLMLRWIEASLANTASVAISLRPNSLVFCLIVGLAALSHALAAVPALLDIRRLRFDDLRRFAIPPTRLGRQLSILVILEFALACVVVAPSIALALKYWQSGPALDGARRTLWVSKLRQPLGDASDARGQFPLNRLNRTFASLLIDVNDGPTRRASIANAVPFVTASPQPVRTSARDRSVPAIATAVSDGYFGMMGLRIVKGRTFDAAERVTPIDPNGDIPSGRAVAVVNEAFEQAAGGGEGLTGQIVMMDEPQPGPRVVIGVVSNETLVEPGHSTGPQIFLPIVQAPQYEAILLIDAERNPQPAIEDAARRADLKIAVAEPRRLDDLIKDRLFTSRVSLELVGLFGALALLLACLGIYSTLALEVASRKREWALRMALGAPPRRIRGIIWAYTIRHLALGLVAGLLGAWVLSNSLDTVFLGGAFHQSHVLFTAGVSVVIAVCLASLPPAITAARANPGLLRND